MNFKGQNNQKVASVPLGAIGQVESSPKKQELLKDKK